MLEKGNEEVKNMQIGDNKNLTKDDLYFEVNKFTYKDIFWKPAL